MKKYISIRTLIKAAVAAVLCAAAVFAQQGQDWFAGEPVAPQRPASAVQAAPAAQAVPAAPAPQPAAEPVAAYEAEGAVPVVGGPSLILAGSNMRLGTEISARALATAPYLHFDRNALPGEGKVMPPKGRTVFQQFDRITVKPLGRKLSFGVGDTVYVVNKMRWVSFKGRPALITVRVGSGVVLGYAGKSAVVSLNEIWGEINGGESIAKAASFKPLQSERLTAPETEVRASVVLRVEETVVPYLHQYIIIDKGSEAGVRPGDFFSIMEKARPNRLSEELMKGQVVNVSSNSATLVIQKLRHSRVSAGDEAVLSFRSEPK